MGALACFVRYIEAETIYLHSNRLVTQRPEPNALHACASVIVHVNTLVAFGLIPGAFGGASILRLHDMAT